MVFFDAIIIDPCGEIDRAIDSETWASAYSTVCRNIEHFGGAKLRSKVPPKKLKEMGCRDILVCLYENEIIDEEIYTELRDINTTRNRLIHPNKKGVGYQEILDKSETRRLLLNAKELIQQIAATKI